MRGILAGSTVLIPMILMIRWLTRGKISMRFRYALWLPVVLRLLVPVNFGSSPYSVLNLAEKAMDCFAIQLSGIPQDGAGAAAKMTGQQNIQDGVSGEVTGSGQTGYPPVRKEADSTQERQSKEQDATAYHRISRKDITLWILSVWFVGMTGTGCYMLTGQMRLVVFLRRVRREISLTGLPQIWSKRLQTHRMRIYLAEGLPVPCLVGRGIYLTPQLWEEKERLLHVLAHEYAHVLQGDSFWVVVSSILCTVYWFHPLVWLAACTARQDSELACDEQALRLLGEEQRFAYGRTLLHLASSGSRKTGYEGVVLFMDGSGQRMKERVMMIAGRRKYNKAVAACVVLLAVAAGGCAFTGEGTKQTSGAARNQSQTQTDSGVDQGLQQQDQTGQAEEEARKAQSIEQGEIEMINNRLDTVEEERNHPAASEFKELLSKTEDDALASAREADAAEYFNYLYEGDECPLEDGAWYLLGGKKEADISFYGLYTKQYGLRGFKMMVGGDVNTFDLPWLPSFMEPEVEVLQWAEDGMPRTFVFQLLRKEDGRHEVWKLYLADRYDAGTVSLYGFEEADYMKQMEDLVELKVDKEARKVDLICGQKVVGSVDISRYADHTVKEAVFDGSAVAFFADVSSGEETAAVAMATCIGLKIEETEMLQYSGLSCVVFPVDIGTWDERTFLLGTPRVDTQRVNGMLSVVE